MVRIIDNERVRVRSKKVMIAMTQELEAGVECNIRDLGVSMEQARDYHIDDLSKLVRALMKKPTLDNLLDLNINPLGRLREIEMMKSEATDEHVVEMCQGLNNSKFLVELSFSNNQIGDFGAKSLGKVLATSHSLISLNLWDNKIGDAGAKALVEGFMQRQYPSHSNIARHFSVQPCKKFSLKLGVNRKISVLGAKAFASLLHKQHSALSPLVTLTNLNLAYCSIHDEGAGAIAESLKGCHKSVGLEELDLSGNLIGNAGAIALAIALKENKVLACLMLCMNRIQLDGGLALCRTLEGYNNTLHRFSLLANRCADEVWKDYLTIAKYSSRSPVLIRKPIQEDVFENSSNHCKLLKANKIFNFISYDDIDEKTKKV